MLTVLLERVDRKLLRQQPSPPPPKTHLSSSNAARRLSMSPLPLGAATTALKVALLLSSPEASIAAELSRRADYSEARREG